MSAQPITRIPTTDPATYAFEISGEITSEAMEDMADLMNAAFDNHDKVNMMLIFRDFEGSETGAEFNWSSIKSRFRALTHVDKYVAVGAPSGAATMIEAMGKLMPVETKAFELAEIDAAWAYLGTRPT